MDRPLWSTNIYWLVAGVMGFVIALIIVFHRRIVKWRTKKAI